MREENKAIMIIDQDIISSAVPSHWPLGVRLRIVQQRDGEPAEVSIIGKRELAFRDEFRRAHSNGVVSASCIGQQSAQGRNRPLQPAR